MTDGNVRQLAAAWAAASGTGVLGTEAVVSAGRGEGEFGFWTAAERAAALGYLMFLMGVSSVGDSSNDCDSIHQRHMVSSGVGGGVRDGVAGGGFGDGSRKGSQRQCGRGSRGICTKVIT